MDTPTTISFEEGELSETCGPFDSIMMIGGILQYGLLPDTYLARLDDQQGVWQVSTQRRSYSAAVFEAP